MKIIYKNPDNSVAVLIPTDEALSFATIEQIAIKDTPEGYPFSIIDDSEMPADRVNREIWEWDASTVPDGVGGTSSEFPDGVLP